MTEISSLEIGSPGKGSMQASDDTGDISSHEQSNPEIEFDNPQYYIDSDSLSVPCQLVIDMLLKKDGLASESSLSYFIEKNSDLLTDHKKSPREQFKQAMKTVIDDTRLFYRDKGKSYNWRLNSQHFRFSRPSITAFHPKQKSSEQDAASSSSQEEQNLVEKNYEGPTFQQTLIDFIKNAEIGVRMEEIIDYMKQFVHLPSLFSNLPVEKRCKAILRHRKEFFYDKKMGLWFCSSSKEKFDNIRKESMNKDMPKHLAEFDIGNLTVSQLYDALIKKGILT